MRRLVSALVAAAALAAPLQAQRPHALQVGSPVRLVGLDVPGGVLTGLLARVTADTVLVGVPGGTEAVRVPRAAVTHVYIQVGRRSGSGRSSMVGLVAGTAVGSVLAFAFRNQMTTPGVFIVAGGAGGAMLGGLVGQYLFRVPRWQEAPLEWLDDAAEAP
jgi:hypothetical protein